MSARELVCRGKKYEISVLLSEEDFEWAASLGNWFITHAVYPTIKKPGYAVRSMGGRLIFLHKEVLLRHRGPPPTPLHRIGDHRNGCTLDNTRGDLRWATPQMNARNIFGIVTRQYDLFTANGD